MNPFSKDYKPTLDLTDVLKDAKISATRSRQRAEGMQSTDMQTRRAAKGTLPALSKRTK